MPAQPQPSPFQLQQLQIRLASAVVETMPEIEPERARALARVWAEQVRRGQQKQPERESGESGLLQMQRFVQLAVQQGFDVPPPAPASA